MLIAGNYRIPEVCVYFNNKLFRGNRSTKIDASGFSAFASPNYPTLGKVGTDIRIRHVFVKCKRTTTPTFTNHSTDCYKYFETIPGLSLDMLQHVLQSPLQALVLESYGVGNAPENSRFLDIIR